MARFQGSGRDRIPKRCVKQLKRTAKRLDFCDAQEKKAWSMLMNHCLSPQALQRDVWEVTKEWVFLRERYREMWLKFNKENQEAGGVHEVHEVHAVKQNISCQEEYCQG